MSAVVALEILAAEVRVDTVAAAEGERERREGLEGIEEWGKG